MQDDVDWNQAPLPVSQPSRNGFGHSTLLRIRIAEPFKRDHPRSNGQVAQSCVGRAGVAQRQPNNASPGPSISSRQENNGTTSFGIGRFRAQRSHWIFPARGRATSRQPQRQGRSAGCRFGQAARFSASGPGSRKKSQRCRRVKELAFEDRRVDSIGPAPADSDGCCTSHSTRAATTGNSSTGRPVADAAEGITGTRYTANRPPDPRRNADTNLAISVG